MAEKIILLALITLVIHGVAYLSVPWFRNRLRDNPRISKGYKEEVERDNPPNDPLNITPGVLERVFFTIVFAFDISGGGTAAIGWITLKMATNWNKTFPKNDEKPWSIDERTKMALCSLYAGLFSLSFALISGLTIRWFLEWLKWIE